MNILILGSGGREHALAWKIKQSPQTEKLFICPGNAGTADYGININSSLSDFDAIKKIVIDENISMLVVGSEVPLVEGIHDFFESDNELDKVMVIGPKKKAAMLEGSKDFAKAFMQKYDIPTASYKSFDKDGLESGLRYLEELNAPYVLKADGLAAGKGVLICETLDEAKQELKEMLMSNKFGNAAGKVVIEEFLEGVELSVFVLTDGKSYKILPEAKDYKRIGEGDTGLNTGGMGSVSPVPFADVVFMKKIEDKIIIPTINGLISENIDYKGFIFFGLIKTNNEPYVIEYNARMGDPEAESIIPRIKSDIIELFKGVANNNIREKEIIFDDRSCVAVMLVSEGYPGSYGKGKLIKGHELLTDSIVFHAGTKFDNNENVVTNGGRVMAISSYGRTTEEALEKSYKSIKKIEFEGKCYRNDIGKDIL